MPLIPTPILAALGGYFFTYYNTRITEERKAQIERVNEQVRSLYGPLLACVTASKSAFEAMVRQHSPDGTSKTFVELIREHPEGREGQIYRQWMKEVLQPLNEKAADIIVRHADLLQSARMEPLLLQLVAHVSAYRVILKRWEAGDLDEWSAITYPDKLHEYVTEEFRRIKKRQADLLGIKEGIRSKL
ncbi:g6925 [Coccomyxa elongata]